MERLSREGMLMEHALVASKRGTCSRLKVGAVFSRQGRILATGYNGAPTGQPHCEHYVIGEGHAEAVLFEEPIPPIPEWVMAMSQDMDRSHLKLGEFFTRAGNRQYFQANTSAGCPVAQHAERNAIDFAARHGISLEGSELHVTHMPCPTCSGSLLNVGIKRVVFLNPYRLREGVDMLVDAGVEVENLIDISAGER